MKQEEKTDLLIRPIAPGEAYPYTLLLDADPYLPMVEQYLDGGQVILALDGDETIAVYVLYKIDNETIELKNIAVDERFQNKGIGTQLLRDAVERARQSGYRRMIICTGNASIGPLYLYQREGFDMSELRRNFVLDHYPEPLYDHGIRVRHMIVLSKDL